MNSVLNNDYPSYLRKHGPTELLGIVANPVDVFDILFVHEW